jgi:hypothetical protein
MLAGTNPRAECSRSIPRAAFVTKIAAAIACLVTFPDVTVMGRDERALAAIGARYLYDRPDEADVGSLRLFVFGDRSATSVGALCRIACEQAARDFARADVVVIEGWVLARTEARLFALAHLRARRAG